MTETITPTEGQERQFGRYVEDAVRRARKKVNPDKDGLQRLIGRGGEFHTGIVRLIAELTRPNQYADEEVESNYTYPKEYKGPRPINEQIMAIAEIFGLDPANALEYAENLPQLPDGAEGWFAVPTASAIAAKHFPEVTDDGKKYCQAVQLVHQKIAESRSFYNYHEGQITPAQLRVHARTAYALDLIADTQKGDILIIAAQLGMRHRGRSVRWAREVFVRHEFGLGSLAVGSIVLTHPERLVRCEELNMDCSGDDFSSGAGASIFGWGGGGVNFNAVRVDDVGEYYGSASGFLPQ